MRLSGLGPVSGVRPNVSSMENTIMAIAPSYPWQYWLLVLYFNLFRTCPPEKPIFGETGAAVALNFEFE